MIKDNAAMSNTEEQYRLKQLENESIYIIREAYRMLRKPALLWSMGKDSTVMLWLAKKAFFGRIPFPVLHIDTSFKIPEMITYRDQKAKEWEIDLRIFQNKQALLGGMNPTLGKLECCTALKTEALKSAMSEGDIQTIFAAIRHDEESSRSKEKIFSPRGEGSSWHYQEQPPEFWNDFQTEFPEKTEVRVHPVLRWTELDIWLYIQQNKIPVLDLYSARNGYRYRSVGCAPCTQPIPSSASTVEEIIAELRVTKIGERSGRAQDQADHYALQKLRAKGYM